MRLQAVEFERAVSPEDARRWLAEAGARVLILEKGPYYTSRDFVHDEVKTCR